jgi:methyl-accepting chemotaxis protein
VAQEVRSLALRSGEASRRVGEIVARSGQDVEACGALVQEASEVLAQSEEQVGGIVGAVGAVTGLSRSGLDDAESLKRLVGDIEMHSRENQRLVNDLRAASAQMRTQGDRLLHRLSQFELS